MTTSRTKSLLLEAAAVLDNPPPEVLFDYGTFGTRSHCGTRACAAGILALTNSCGLEARWYGGRLMFAPNGYGDPFRFLTEHFGISYEHAYWLFAIYGGEDIDGNNRDEADIIFVEDVKPHHIAAACRELAELY